MLGETCLVVAWYLKEKGIERKFQKNQDFLSQDSEEEAGPMGESSESDCLGFGNKCNLLLLLLLLLLSSFLLLCV